MRGVDQGYVSGSYYGEYKWVLRTYESALCPTRTPPFPPYPRYSRLVQRDKRGTASTTGVLRTRGRAHSAALEQRLAELYLDIVITHWPCWTCVILEDPRRDALFFLHGCNIVDMPDARCQMRGRCLMRDSIIPVVQTARCCRTVRERQTI